tara:strand:+ start:92 stop:526 length:435 start_codon:yes stop_codon:yes gene_type:complete
MVWAAAFAAVAASNDKRNAGARAYSIAAILSNNPLLVTLQTFVAQIPCKHWRSAEILSRGGSAWQGVKRLTEPLRRLSGLISVPDRSAAIDSAFSLLSTLNSASIVSTNCNNGLIHRPRHFWGGANTINAEGLAIYSSAGVGII